MLSDKKFSFTELLDFTLVWFTQEPEEFSLNDLTPRQNVTSYQIGESMIKKYPELNSHHFSYHLDFILDKLYSDGYVDREQNHHRNKVDISKYIYSVKLDAFIFQKQGGYTKKEKKEKWDRIWKRIENAPKRYWFVGLFVITQAYNLNDLVKDVSKYLSHPAKKESSKQFPKQDTSRNR